MLLIFPVRIPKDKVAQTKSSVEMGHKHVLRNKYRQKESKGKKSRSLPVQNVRQLINEIVMASM